MSAPSLIFWYDDGRLPTASDSSNRVSISFTGRPVSRDSLAASEPSTPGPNFAPNPPPMKSVITRTLFCGIFRLPARPSLTLKIPCVEAQGRAGIVLHGNRIPARLERLMQLHRSGKLALHDHVAFIERRRDIPSSLIFASPRFGASEKTRGASGLIASTGSTTKDCSVASTSITRSASRYACLLTPATLLRVPHRRNAAWRSPSFMATAACMPGIALALSRFTERMIAEGHFERRIIAYSHPSGCTSDEYFRRAGHLCGAVYTGRRLAEILRSSWATQPCRITSVLGSVLPPAACSAASKTRG